MSNVSTNSSTNLDTSNLGPVNSMQLMYAKLQLEMSDMAKEQALDRMEIIAQTQEEQKLCLQYINTARQLQAESVNASGGQMEMPDELAQYMDMNGLAYDTTGNDLLMSSDEWDVAITSLESHMEQLGARTQQEMVYVQDYMGQYNSYLQGANTQINNANQTLTSLSRGQTMYRELDEDMVIDSGLVNMEVTPMTQSMYGGVGTGLTAVTLMVGIVFGCLMTLFVQKVSKGKTKS